MSNETERDAKGRWLPGVSGNTKGRPPISEQIQDAVRAEFNGKAMHEVLISIAKKNPREAVTVLMGLLPYMYPKLSMAQIEAKVSSTLMQKAEELMEKPDHELIELNQQLLKEAKDNGSNSG